MKDDLKRLAEEDEPQKGVGAERLRAAWDRRKWLAVLIFVVPFVAASTLLLSLPAFYRSPALVLVDRQQVPESFLRPTVDHAKVLGIVFNQGPSVLGHHSGYYDGSSPLGHPSRQSGHQGSAGARHQEDRRLAPQASSGRRIEQTALCGGGCGHPALVAGPACGMSMARGAANV